MSQVPNWRNLRKKKVVHLRCITPFPYDPSEPVIRSNRRDAGTSANVRPASCLRQYIPGFDAYISPISTLHI